MCSAFLSNVLSFDGTASVSYTHLAGVALVKAGAAIVGGCCGTTEKHIKALSEDVYKRQA